MTTTTAFDLSMQQVRRSMPLLTKAQEQTPLATIRRAKKAA